ncbi:MAG: hypothetical protein QOE90_626, partial [Thermoplasmata archaeon]|nr:hypothetical protein [Thermoplasmata archaeon]
GACFSVPSGSTRYRVTIHDDVSGPGFGFIYLCAGASCQADPICDGVAEGAVPAGTTDVHVSVSTAPFYPAAGWCALTSLAWVPTHGKIALDFT